MEGQESYKWDIGELSQALSRLVKKGMVTTTEKGARAVESRR